jgi:hypothetical protein
MGNQGISQSQSEAVIPSQRLNPSDTVDTFIQFRRHLKASNSQASALSKEVVFRHVNITLQSEDSDANDDLQGQNAYELGLLYA